MSALVGMGFSENGSKRAAVATQVSQEHPLNMAGSSVMTIMAGPLACKPHVTLSHVPFLQPWSSP